jgi:hypothetical protein
MSWLISGLAGVVPARQKINVVENFKQFRKKFYGFRVSLDRPGGKIIGWQLSMRIILHGHISATCSSGTMLLLNYIVSTAFRSICSLIPQEDHCKKPSGSNLPPNCVVLGCN